jgi:hypothetical protein
MYFSLSRTACTRASAHLRARAWLTVRLFMDGFSWGEFGVNILHLTTSSKVYVLFMFTHRTARMRASARVRARAWFNSQLSLDGFSSNLMGTYYKWSQVTWDTYLSCSITACVCERACASASVIKRSLIFKRILFRFGGDIRQIPIGYMRYLICVWMHVLTARTC